MEQGFAHFDQRRAHELTEELDQRRLAAACFAHRQHRNAALDAQTDRKHLQRTTVGESNTLLSLTLRTLSNVRAN